MNLQKLFEMQAKLDKKIVEEKGLEGQDLLPKKILALQVELGELANEWRGFKFWSNNQKPRTRCPHCEGTGLCHYLGYADPLQPCGYCNGYPKRINPLLEEFADALHFILSIGLELEITAIEIDSDYTHEDPSATFVELFGDTWELFNFREIHDKQSKFIQIIIYERMFNRFIGIGEKHLGFTWEQIEEAYLEKNRINHERQESNY